MGLFGRSLAVWFVLVATSIGAEQPVLSQFVKARGDKLFVGDEEYRFLSFNIPNLHLVEDNFSFANPSPWRWPNEFEIRDALETIRLMGGNATRIYVLSVRREGSDMGEHVHVRAPGDFNETAFRVLDKVLQIANEKGIRVIIPLVDNWHWWGGRAEYASFRGKSPDKFWTDKQLLSDFEETIRFTLNRVNTYTGVAYKDDPAIFGWETGNELDSTPEWTRHISAFIKSQDSNHLVIDGFALHGVRQASLDDPNIDVITTHHYPNTDADYVAAITRAHEQTRGKKPYFVGEFGFASVDELRDVMDTIIARDISGGMLWSLRFHNRDGGFYWHSESSGENVFKAYHWPGFNSGKAYHERELLQLTQRKAFEIQGLPVPEVVAPEPPKLLPMEQVSRISWQGSAGASSYDIQRATAPDGAWQTLSTDTSDAAVQYRPLFADNSAEIDKSYSYRVVAKNSAGTSVPSNTVGPIRVSSLVLVDECRNLEMLHQDSTGIKLLSTQARKTQEDLHRFELTRESRLIYRVEQPINAWQLHLFSQERGALPKVHCSIDGKNFLPCKSAKLRVPTGANDYGYQFPFIVRGTPSQPGCKFLSITLGADSPSVEISRVEIEHGKAAGAANIKAPTSNVGAQLNPSILMFHKPYHTQGIEYVRRAAALGSDRVNVVVTLLCDIDNENRVRSYGMLKRGKYTPLNEQLITELRDSLTQVFTEVRAHNMELSVLAHLNAGGKIYEWRNHFQFDPLRQYKGYSYKEALIDTIAEALLEAKMTNAGVDFSLTGEMGHSVFSHPESYLDLVNQLRNNKRLPLLQLGFSFNFNKAAAEHEPTDSQRAAMQRLLEACDFIGMSNYRWFDLPIEPADFTNAVHEFLADMQRSGVTVPATMPVHFSEVGIGGGTSKGLASTPAEASKTPWEGSDNPRKNPWSSAKMQSFRREFHAALLEFLANPSAENPVTEAFLWSEGSWDPQDIVNKGFADEKIIDKIRKHNQSIKTH